jgi:hypothetical protein
MNPLKGVFSRFRAMWRSVSNESNPKTPPPPTGAARPPILILSPTLVILSAAKDLCHSTFQPSNSANS